MSEHATGGHRLQILMRDGTAAEVEAHHREGPFSVHRKVAQSALGPLLGEDWTVTHTFSGIGVDTSRPMSEDQAVALAREFAKIKNSSDPFPSEECFWLMGQVVRKQLHPELSHWTRQIASERYRQFVTRYQEALPELTLVDHLRAWVAHAALHFGSVLADVFWYGPLPPHWTGHSASDLRHLSRMSVLKAFLEGVGCVSREADEEFTPREAS